LPHASHEAQAMLQFGKFAEKLRDALGTVRELDVWIGKLRALRDSLSATPEYVPRSARETARQIERLELRLAKKRERAGVKLVSEIGKRKVGLLQAARDLEKVSGQQAHEADVARASKLLRDFAAIVADFPVLDEENLHDFRKRIKKVRYVAELHAADPQCADIAKHVKKAQDAIGEWHDWQILARTAGHGKHAKDVEAAELLSSLTAEAYEAAVATCHSVLRRMSDLEREKRVEIGPVRKVPVRREVPSSGTIKKLA